MEDIHLGTFITLLERSDLTGKVCMKTHFPFNLFTFIFVSFFFTVESDYIRVIEMCESASVVSG